MHSAILTERLYGSVENGVYSTYLQNINKIYATNSRPSGTHTFVCNQRAILIIAISTNAAGFTATLDNSTVLYSNYSPDNTQGCIAIIDAGQHTLTFSASHPSGTYWTTCYAGYIEIQ